MLNWISAETRETFRLRWFGLTKIPMLLFVRPKVAAISPERIAVTISLTRRTRNHLGSMYFGALSVGADCAAGALAMHLMRGRPERISLIFGAFNAEFHKRAEGDVQFTCDEGRAIEALIAQAAASEERVEMPVRVIATVPALGAEPVATFTLTLSLKRKA
jgi:acyl-coenzyme A thioesterase PaaI-like protein